MIGTYDFSAQVQPLRAALYQHIGWTYHAASPAPPALLPLQAYGVITSRTQRFNCLGALSGQGYDGQSFSLVDVTAPSLFCKAGNERDIDPGFQGVILSLSVPHSFTERTLIMDDFGPANAARIDGMKRVGMVDRAFERKFEVYGDDQVEARSLVTPDFIERIMDLSRHYLGRGVQCLFLGRLLHIALNIDDRFRFSHDFAAFNAKDAADVIIAEAGAVCLLLEQAQTLQASVGRSGTKGADEARQQFYAGKLQTLLDALPSLLKGWKTNSPLPEDMHHTQYLFCDSIKGMAGPRM